MFTWFEFFIATRYIISTKRDKWSYVIIIISLIGIILGVSILILTTSIMNGFEEEWIKKIIGLEGHVSVISHTDYIEDYEKITYNIKKNHSSKIKDVFPIIEGQGLLSVYEDNNTGIFIRCIDNSYLNKMINQHIVSNNISELKNNDIIIGKDLSERMGINIGEEISLISSNTISTLFGSIPFFNDYKVIGIFDAGMSNYDSGMVYIPIQSGHKLFSIPNNTVNKLEIIAHKSEESQVIVKTLKKDTELKKFIIQNWQSKNNKLFDALKVERYVMFLILLMIIIISSFNVVSSLVLIVRDKKLDIAIMKSMGASNICILKIFFIMGITIGILGTIIGSILGIFITYKIETIRKYIEDFSGVNLLDKTIYFFSQIPISLHSSDVIMIIGISIFISALSTLIPSIYAANQDPAQYIRYD